MFWFRGSVKRPIESEAGNGESKRKTPSERIPLPKIHVRKGSVRVEKSVSSTNYGRVGWLSVGSLVVARRENANLLPSRPSSPLKVLIEI